MDKTTLYVLDWQIRNVLRLRNQLKNAGFKKAERIRRNIQISCQNMDFLDPDKTKRLELVFLYFREHLRTAGAKRRLNLLTHSLSDFLFSCGPTEKLDDHLLRQLLGNKTIAHIIQNFDKENASVCVKSNLPEPPKKQITHD